MDGCLLFTEGDARATVEICHSIEYEGLSKSVKYHRCADKMVKLVREKVLSDDRLRRQCVDTHVAALSCPAPLKDGYHSARGFPYREGCFELSVMVSAVELSIIVL